MEDRIRVLQVVGGLSRAGTETWLRNVLRHTDPAQIHMTFVVDSPAPGHYDEDVRASGGHIVACPGASRPWTYAANLRRILRRVGPFDVVHSHVHHFSGLVLAVAQVAGVRTRIAHSHLGPRGADARMPRRLYTGGMERLIARCATHGFAASEQAAAALFGPGWSDDGRFEVLFCGIDLTPFRRPRDRREVRRELHVSDDAFVIGHVGRFEEQKNHGFLVDLLARIIGEQPRALLLLVGDGPLRDTIAARARALGVGHRVLFTGTRSDVPDLLNAMDVFVMPSLYEGLGLAAVEAQASGLTVIASESIPREMAAVPGRVLFLPLSDGPERWARRIARAEGPCAATRSAALGHLERSPFDVRQSAADLCSRYTRAARPALGGPPRH